MIKYMIALILGLIFCIGLMAAEAGNIKVQELRGNDIEDWNQRLEDNEVLFSNVVAIQVVDDREIYYLGTSICSVLRVNLNTGKLINTIGRRGQGPSELQLPQSMVVKNGKVFIFDFGFNGIKIYTLDGTLHKEFKMKTQNPSLGFTDYKTMAVNSKNHIYLRDLDQKSNSIISVYNEEGKRLRSILPLNAQMEKDGKDYVGKTKFSMFIDGRDKLVVLYHLKKELVKYNEAGEILWQRNLYDDITPEERNRPKFNVNIDKRGTVVSYRLDFMDVSSMSGDRIFVSSYRCGLIYSPQGEPEKKIKQPDGEGFGSVTAWAGDLLITPYIVYNVTPADSSIIK